MNLKVYVYDKCSTCQKALKFLAAEGISFTKIPIREQPPTPAELKRMLKFQEGELRRLFNTSGRDYRALNIKEQLPTLTESAAIDLLAGNGNLIKRPFAITKEFGLVGFKEDAWRSQLGL